MGVIMCNNNCGVELHFDSSFLSKSGKMIPLEGDNRPHNCPNNPYRKRSTHTANGISFDEINGFLRFGNFILRKNDFCEKCRIYKGLLSIENGGMLIAYSK